MTFIPVPGVAATVLSGKIGNNPWAVTHHWRNGSSTTPWTQADGDLLAQAVFQGMNTTLRSNMGTNVTWTQSTMVDLTNSSGVGSLYTPIAVHGNESGVLEPSSACVVVQNRIAARYRGGHPRTFWPCGTGTDMADEATWTASLQNAVASAVASWVTYVQGRSYSFGSTSLEHVIPRYSYTYTDVPGKHKYTKERNALIGVDVVQAYISQAIIGSQRRRLRV